MAKITIKDVAREAGVSISTVSNALNGVEVLKPATRERILEVAKQLNYIPDMNGRCLKAGKTKVIGLFVPDMDPAYYGSISNSIFQECQKEGYELQIFISHQSAAMMKNLLGKRVDGAIILNDEIKEEHVHTIVEAEVPVVFLDREVCGKKAASVLFDSYHDGAMAAQYLLDRGFTRLGYILGIAGNYDDRKRYEGYRDTIEAAGCKLEDKYIWRGDFERKQAHDAVQHFLETKESLPEAVFAANDLSAIGCMEALQKVQIRIPHDIHILGCDDIELAEWYKPSLTTIRTEYPKQGRLAAQKLFNMIYSKEQGNVVKMKGRMIERQSV